MTDQQGKPCKDHPKIDQACMCDERRDRVLKIHRASTIDDMMGGYLCICYSGRYSPKYGCMGEGYGSDAEKSFIDEYEL